LGKFDQENIHIDLGSDQTSLHNPWAGGYYPADISFEEANSMMAEKPELFKIKVQETLRRHTTAINKHTARTYFFDYGNAFLLEARSGADVMAENHIDFRYQVMYRTLWDPCDYGFGPFRWGMFGKTRRFAKTDVIACRSRRNGKTAPEEIQQQMDIQWIKGAQENKLVVGSQAQSLCGCGRTRKIAEAFNQAIKGEIGTVILGRDHRCFWD
jgi:urocanate hydratase